MSSELQRQFMAQLRLAQVAEPVQELPFARPRKWRFDAAWPDLKVAVEIDGGTRTRGRHVRHEGFEKDCEKLNTAALLGWRVFRFTSDMVRDGRALATVLAEFDPSGPKVPQDRSGRRRARRDGSRVIPCDGNGYSDAEGLS